jgi:peptidoglycan/LPS O-acetylase OafA/YrhL
LTQDTEIWPFLAGMRFFFAMWVLFDHTYNFGPEDRAMPILSGSGLMPVMCFLVISGYSIHHSISIQRNGYFARRFWRIAPTNLVSVALALSAYTFLGPSLIDGRGNPWLQPGIFSWLVYLIPAQCLIPISIAALFPTWSLSIEVAYYAIAPLLLRASTKFLITIIGVSASGFAAWTYFPTTIATPRYVAEATIGVGVVVFAWAWLAGWIAYRSRRNIGLFLIFCGIGCICVLLQKYGFQTNDTKSSISTYTTWIVTMAVVFFRPSFEMPAQLRSVLTYLGDLSFPLYLFHYPALFIVLNSVWKAHPEWNYGVFQVMISIAAAIVVLHSCDRPLRRFGRNKPSAQGSLTLLHKPLPS